MRTHASPVRRTDPIRRSVRDSTLDTRQRLCFIHVGTHKTGTTSLQAFLRDNQELFAELGVLIPRAGRGEDAAGHHNLTQELLGAAGFRAEWGGLEEVSNELRRSDKRRACISSEDFSLASRSAQLLTTLRDGISQAGFTPIIVIYLRPQVSYCLSIYAEIVKNGNRKRFDQYLREIREYGTFLWNGSLGPLCRYDVVLERFAAVFGRDAVIVRRYRSAAPKNALLRSFAELIAGGPVAFASFAVPPERFNPSLSFSRVLQALGSDAIVTDMRFAPLDIAGTLELAASFYASNRQIFARYGTWIPPCELNDVLLALPWRKTLGRTQSLHRARAGLKLRQPDCV